MANEEVSSRSVDEIEQFIQKTMWRSANVERLLLKGSFRAPDNSVIVDDQLPPVEYTFTLIHEGIHAHLATFHYGEMIRRIEAFGQLMAIPINLLRGKLITELYQTKYGKIDENFPIAVMSDTIFRRTIKDRLMANDTFMHALRFLNDIEDKKLIFLNRWKKTQEGGAYWQGLNTFERVTLPFMKKYWDENLLVKGEELTRRWKETLLKSKSFSGEGYRMVKDIEGVWGEEWVFPVLEVCMCPDITQIPILNALKTAIEEMLATSKISPDVRLETIRQIAITQMFTPPSLGASTQYEQRWYAMYPLVKMLDPENPNPPLTVEAFNNFWMTLDADIGFVTLMDELLKEVNIKQKYEPIQVFYNRNPNSKTTVTARNKEGELSYFHRANEDELTEEGFQELAIRSTLEGFSLRKDILIRTMKAEGIL